MDGLQHFSKKHFETLDAFLWLILHGSTFKNICKGQDGKIGNLAYFTLRVVSLQELTSIC